MAPPLRRVRLLRRASIAVAAGVVCSMAPLPAFDFVASASASTVPLPELGAVTDAELAAMAGAVEGDLADDRVVGAVDDTSEFSMIGVALDEAPTDPVLVRVLEDDAWSEWIELEYSGDNGPDEGSAEQSSNNTEPLWVGDATGYEVSLGGSDAPSAEVTLVRETTRRVMTETVPLADAAMPVPFGVQPRSAWGARAAASTPSYASAVRMAVVHHTASSNNYSAAQVPGIIRGMQAFHMDGNGWSDLAYNFIVDRFGTIWEGRGGGITRPVIGAHAKGFNTGSVGVSVIGNYVGANPTQASLEGVARVVGWRLEEYNVDPRAWGTFTSGGSTSIPAGQVINSPVVVGHRDVGATSCPGAIQGSLGFIRDRGRAWFDVSRAQHNPIGRVDGINTGPGAITTAGWALDRDTGNPIDVTLILNGKWHTAPANRPRGDWQANYPGHGNDHGFAIGVDVPPGRYSACLVALNAGEGVDSFLMCRDVVVK